jgi:hypothetical protein
LKGTYKSEKLDLSSYSTMINANRQAAFEVDRIKILKRSLKRKRRGEKVDLRKCLEKGKEEALRRRKK